MRVHGAALGRYRDSSVVSLEERTAALCQRASTSTSEGAFDGDSTLTARPHAVCAYSQVVFGGGKRR
eukprot:scaffold8943_cov103-Isochrysis_galbana.AAC.3